jgi:hypothetical protein
MFNKHLSKKLSEKLASLFCLSVKDEEKTFWNTLPVLCGIVGKRRFKFDVW